MSCYFLFTLQDVELAQHPRIRHFAIGRHLVPYLENANWIYWNVLAAPGRMLYRSFSGADNVPFLTNLGVPAFPSYWWLTSSSPRGGPPSLSPWREPPTCLTPGQSPSCLTRDEAPSCLPLKSLFCDGVLFIHVPQVFTKQAIWNYNS